MKPYITHVALSGGGMKGICYLGVLRYMYIENLMDNIKFIHGTSIGSFFTLAFALKIPLDEFEDDVKEIIKTFNEHEDLAITQRKIYDIMYMNGICDIRFMMKPFIKYLKKHYDIDDITFQELSKKTGVNIYIKCMNINTGKSRTFSNEDSPNVSVLDACVASMIIPFLMQPIKIEDDYYIDGETCHDRNIEMFENALDKNKLHILICECREYTMETIENDSKIDFMKFSTRVFNILLKKIFYMFKLSTHELKTEEYVLKIHDFHYKNAIQLKLKESNELRIETSDEDFENYILRGFIDMTNYMNKRYKDNVIDIK